MKKETNGVDFGGGGAGGGMTPAEREKLTELYIKVGELEIPEYVKKSKKFLAFKTPMGATHSPLRSNWNIGNAVYPRLNLVEGAKLYIEIDYPDGRSEIKGYELKSCNFGGNTILVTNPFIVDSHAEDTGDNFSIYIVCQDGVGIMPYGDYMQRLKDGNDMIATYLSREGDEAKIVYILDNYDADYIDNSGFEQKLEEATNVKESMPVEIVDFNPDTSITLLRCNFPNGSVKMYCMQVGIENEVEVVYDNLGQVKDTWQYHITNLDGSPLFKPSHFRIETKTPIVEYINDIPKGDENLVKMEEVLIANASAHPFSSTARILCNGDTERKEFVSVSGTELTLGGPQLMKAGQTFNCSVNGYSGNLSNIDFCVDDKRMAKSYSVSVDTGEGQVSLTASGLTEGVYKVFAYDKTNPYTKSNVLELCVGDGYTKSPAYCKPIVRKLTDAKGTFGYEVVFVFSGYFPNVMKLTFSAEPTRSQEYTRFKGETYEKVVYAFYDVRAFESLSKLSLTFQHYSSPEKTVPVDITNI